MNFIIISLALGLDQLLGEPKRFHPLVGFGNCANWFARVLNQGGAKNDLLAYGALSLVLLIAPPLLCVIILGQLSGDYEWVLNIIIVYWAIGLKSMRQHSKAVFSALANGKLVEAQTATAFMVSRDTDHMNKQQVSAATVESILENGNDSIFAVLFWFLLGGAPMVVFYRLVNTLDAMWGYRTKEFEYFGKIAARLDDVLNYIPARLTAVSYALMGRFKLAIQAWLSESKELASPNGGPVMTAGAGSLDVELGGDAYYHGEIAEKLSYGGTQQANRQHIQRANKLIVKVTLLWCVIILGIDLLLWSLA